MAKKERKWYSLIREAVKPALIYELRYVALPNSEEWAASVALKDGSDRRFRFVPCKGLIDEATIGDARIA